MFVDPTDLARHAVCLGMTGSGKTGLCVGLLEDVAATGVPVLALDPKGDLANMALVFPELVPDAFRPWTPDPERRGADLEGRDAARRHRGVGSPGGGAGADAGQRVGHPGRRAHHADPRAAPPLGDVEGLRELVTGAVSALLGLIGRAADPLTDPSAILLSRLLGDAFARGEDLPLDTSSPRSWTPRSPSSGTSPSTPSCRAPSGSRWPRRSTPWSRARPSPRGGRGRRWTSARG
jgi:hypothetical protein